MSKGIKSSEFWLALAAQLVSFALASGLVTNDRALQGLGLAASVLAALGYGSARTWLKSKQQSSAVSLTAPIPAPASTVTFAAPEKYTFTAPGK